MAKRREKAPRRSARSKNKAGPLDAELPQVDHFLEEVEALTGEREFSPEEPLEETAGLEDDPRAQDIAAALKQPLEALGRRRAGPEAGEDEGETFYTLSLGGATLAIRADALRAYLADIEAAGLDKEPMAELLRSCGLAEIEVPAFKEAPNKSLRKTPPWIEVARGRAPVPGGAERIEYFHPGRSQQRLSAETLSLISLELHERLYAGTLDEAAIQELRGLAVVPGSVLARLSSAGKAEPGRDVFGRELPAAEAEQTRPQAGAHVSLSPEGEYRAERYGYLCLAGNQLSVLSPLWIDAENMHAYWVVLDEHAQPVAPEMIAEWLRELEVVVGVRQDQIDALAARLREGGHTCGLFPIAAGEKPRDGEDARVEILVDLERQAGKERPDGSIDFREVNFAPTVKAEQLVARRTPPGPGSPGRDLKDNILPAEDGEDHVLEAGDNLRMEMEGEVELFYATINGALRMSGDELSVAELLNIKGDVSFSTGNLDFGGEIYIDGSVVQGFSVKAGGAIVIAGTVEPGSTVVSREDITVGKGIVGRKTRVVARGSVRAQFVQEARVLAGGEIALGNCAYHAYLRAETRVVVSKGTGTHGGSIVGGQTWAREGIEIHNAGALSETTTLLMAGLDPEQARQLDKLKNSIDTGYEHILRILKHFGLNRIDLGQIQSMIKASTGPRRKVLAHYAQQLGQLAQAYQKMLAGQKELEECIGAALEGTEIQVRGKAFPGVVIRLGEHQRKLADEVNAPRFHIADGKLQER